MANKQSSRGLSKGEFNRLAAMIRRHVLAMEEVAGIRGNVWERVKDSFSRHRRRSFDGIVIVETDDTLLVAISLTAYYGIVLPRLAERIQEELKVICREYGPQRPVSVRVFIDNVVTMETK